jgi:hypothetical protein
MTRCMRLARRLRKAWFRAAAGDSRKGFDPWRIQQPHLRPDGIDHRLCRRDGQMRSVVRHDDPAFPVIDAAALIIAAGHRNRWAFGPSPIGRRRLTRSPASRPAR